MKVSKEKFTKGEWKANGALISCKGYGYIAKALNIYIIRNERLANAHLIAAAPEMYKEIEKDICRAPAGALQISFLPGS